MRYNPALCVDLSVRAKFLIGLQTTEVLLDEAEIIVFSQQTPTVEFQALDETLWFHILVFKAFKTCPLFRIPLILSCDWLSKELQIWKINKMK